MSRTDNETVAAAVGDGDAEEPPPIAKDAAEGDLEAASSGPEEQRKSLERGTFKSRFDFLIYLIAYAVGLGNIWRFPYLCFHHGGGTFLVAYLVFFITVALPIFFMEVSVGQFMGMGASEVWKMAPIFKGVGIGNLVLCFFLGAYYDIIIAWGVFYLWKSFAKDFEWESCNGWWNNETSCISTMLSSDLMRELKRNMSAHNITAQTSVQQFFYGRMLRDSYDVAKFETINYDLAIILALIWVFIYFCIWKGITKARWFVWFSALFPYVIILILVGRGVTLPGAWEGIKFYFTPKWRALLSVGVWKDAGTQVFFSYSIGFGTLVSLGAYNKFNHNCYRDSILTCCINGGTSILAGFAVFGILGHLAHVMETDIANIVQRGTGLAFLAYPEVVTRLMPKQLWSVLFFIMLILLGLNSELCTVESLYASAEDRFPHVFRRYKKLGVLGLSVFMYLIGLVMLTHAGNYWLVMFDNYAASGVSLLLVVFFEIIGFSYGFGVNRICDAVHTMLGFRPSWYWRIMWRFGSPLVVGTLFVMCVILLEPARYTHNDEPWPAWAHYLGNGLGVLSVIWIPIYACYYLFFTHKHMSFVQRFKKGFRVDADFNQARIEASQVAATEDIAESEEEEAPSAKTAENAKKPSPAKQQEEPVST